MVGGREFHLAKGLEIAPNNEWRIAVMKECPVCGMMVDEATSPRLEYQGITYAFMSPAHKEMFEKDPGKYVSDDSAAGPWNYLDAKSGRKGGCCG
jgi:YHS domain-containing protein